MIKSSQAIPETVDTANADSMRAWLIAAKLIIEEILSKGLPIQGNIMSTVPVAADFESDFQVIPYNSGATYRLYVLFAGTPRYLVLT